MTTIKKVIAREVLDSRGYPTVEVEVVLSSGHTGRMMVPSGASTGKFEAWELRDGDPSRFRGKGVLKAVHNVRPIERELIGKDPADQEALDMMMCDLDGTPNKSILGANAILGVSLACAHAAAASLNLPMYKYLAQRYPNDSVDLSIPVPMVNIISGGLHAGKNVDVQDFMVIPLSAKTYPEALEMISNVYWTTKDLLRERGYNSSLLADEGGFGPLLRSNEEGLEILSEVFVKCGYEGGKDIAIALDVAASHFFEEGGSYRLQSEGRSLNSSEVVDMLQGWTKNYPIVSIEDGLAEEDWEGWKQLTSRLNRNIQLVGDDLFTTNPSRIRMGIEYGAANAVLIKMNQIGTLTETVEAVSVARSAGYNTVISARSGETEDSTLADLAVGLRGGQIKIGSLARSSRLAKYNQLLRINEELGDKYAGWNSSLQ
jgi:enolase